MPPARLFWQQRCAQLLRRPVAIKVSLWYCQLKVKCSTEASWHSGAPLSQSKLQMLLNYRFKYPGQRKTRLGICLGCSAPLSFWCPCTEPQQGLTPLGLEELAQMSEEISQLYWILKKHCPDGSVGHEWGDPRACCSRRARFLHWLCAGMVKLGFWLTSPVFPCPAIKTKTPNNNQTKSPKQTKNQNQE